MAENGENSIALDHDVDQNGQVGMSPRLNEATQKYLQDLLLERGRMENQFPLALKLIDEALERVQLNGRLPTRDQYADVYQQRTIKLSQKVHVPIKDKKFNYVGKLLGPKGNSLRRLQEETQCRIVILGRFSMKDRAREEELRNSTDIKYAHLNLPLHVEVTTIAPPAEAYARMAYALAELRRYLIPDKHDDIRQEQFRELMEDPEAAKKISIRQQQISQHPLHGRSQPGLNMSRPGNGYFRPKFQQPQSQNYHNDENVYYRSNSNSTAQSNYHQQKYLAGSQRSNQVHGASISQPPQPQSIIGASSTGIVVSAAASNFNRRAVPNHIPPNNTVIDGAASGHSNMRYRTIPYQFVKK